MKLPKTQLKSLDQTPSLNGVARNGSLHLDTKSIEARADRFECYPNQLFYDPNPDDLQDYPDPAPFDIDAPAFYDPDPNNLEDYPEPAFLATIDVHFHVMKRLFELLEDWLREQPMAYVAADLLVYYQKRKAIAPDVMVCFGVEKKMRRSYTIAKEKQPPTAIFEILSNTTALADQTTKFDLYDELKIQEYFLFDPEQSLMDEEGLKGYRINSKGIYEKIIKRKGRLESQSLGLEVGRQGQMVGLYNPKTKSWLPDRLENQIIREKAGVSKGEILGSQNLIRKLASGKFGDPSKNELKALKSIQDVERLGRIALQIGNVSTWSDLLKTP